VLLLLKVMESIWNTSASLGLLWWQQTNTLYKACRRWIKIVEGIRISSSQTAIEVAIPTTTKRSRGSELRTEGRAKKPRNSMSNSKQYSESYGGYPIGSIIINRHRSYHLCRLLQYTDTLVLQYPKAAPFRLCSPKYHRKTALTEAHVITTDGQ
jgi:hypothetical protein